MVEHKSKQTVKAVFIGAIVLQAQGCFDILPLIINRKSKPVSSQSFNMAVSTSLHIKHEGTEEEMQAIGDS